MIIAMVIYSLLTPKHSLWRVLFSNVYEAALAHETIFHNFLSIRMFLYFVPAYNIHKTSAKVLKSALGK